MARPFCISGPSGTGKSTLLHALFAKYPDRFGFSVSHTTRSPRPGEEDGVAYHFVSRDEFERMVSNNEFLEHAQFGKNLYGTSSKAVQDVVSRGRTCILDIESQGVQLVKKNHPHLNTYFIFIAPPSLSDLRKRLESRGTESDEEVRIRLGTARTELDYARTGAYDSVVVNDDLKRATELLERIIVKGESVSDKLSDDLFQ